MDSGISSTLHLKIHHQIIYSKLNLKIEYPTYEIWDYNRAKTGLINRAIESLIGQKCFLVKIYMNKL